MAIKGSCMNFVFLTLYARSILKKYMGYLHNRAYFHQIIKRKINNPMLSFPRVTYCSLARDGHGGHSAMPLSLDHLLIF